MPFGPVTFRTARGYTMHVSSLHGVVRAMAMAWPDKDCALYRSAACLAERASQGWCTPRAAYEAFVAAARAQGSIVEPAKLRDRVARELAAIEPEVFEPLAAPRLRSRLTAPKRVSRKSHV